MGPTALRVKKNIHRQNQIKPCGSWRYIEVLRHETIGLCKKLNSIYRIFYLTKQSVGARNWTVFISFFTTSSVHNSRCVTRLLLLALRRIADRKTRRRRTRVTHQLLWTHSVRWIRGKKWYKYCSVSCTDDRFVSLGLNVSSRAAGFNLVLSVYVFFDSQSRESHWLLYMTDRLQRFELKGSYYAFSLFEF